MEQPKPEIAVFSKSNQFTALGHIAGGRLTIPPGFSMQLEELMNKALAHPDVAKQVKAGDFLLGDDALEAAGLLADPAEGATKEAEEGETLADTSDEVLAEEADNTEQIEEADPDGEPEEMSGEEFDQFIEVEAARVIEELDHNAVRSTLKEMGVTVPHNIKREEAAKALVMARLQANSE